MVKKKATQKNKAPAKKKARSKRPPKGDQAEHPNAGGRPTKYDPSMDVEARRVCRLFGATDDELAAYLEIDRSTLYDWKNAHPSFAAAIRKGKVYSDAKVAERTYFRACGYEHQAVKMFMHEGTVIVQEYTERYPPDTHAASLWLRNRQPDYWRDKIDHEHAGPGRGPIPVASMNYDANLAECTPEEAARLYREFIKSAA